MDNRSWGHVAKYNAKWLRQFRIGRDLRSFFYWIILSVFRVLTFFIENNDMILMCFRKYFYNSKKSSVFPRMIWRPSNFIGQFKWHTDQFKIMKKFTYWQYRAVLLTCMSSTFLSDIFFCVVIFRFKLFDKTARNDWISSLDKKDCPKSSSDWTRGRNNRHCLWKCAYRVYFIEYDSGSMNLSITFYTKLSLTFFFLGRFRISHSRIFC